MFGSFFHAPYGAAGPQVQLPTCVSVCGVVSYTYFAPTAITVWATPCVRKQPHRAVYLHRGCRMPNRAFLLYPLGLLCCFAMLDGLRSHVCVQPCANGSWMSKVCILLPGCTNLKGVLYPNTYRTCPARPIAIRTHTCPGITRRLCGWLGATEAARKV